MTETVAILGVSDDESRYSNMAMYALQKHEHRVVLVNPRLEQIEGQQCYKSLSLYQGDVDTITLYVAPKILVGLVPEIIAARPKRVIFNPGTEDAAVMAELQAQGIVTQEACTLVLLSTRQYDDYQEGMTAH